ncbi:DUF2931 family protein [Stutzerimonas frequens]|uniref:DUF2931 family protein n=1 Tax=Stutzerimonas frequens TaxID=2968969 RepID=UPI003F536BA5
MARGDSMPTWAPQLRWQKGSAYPSRNLAFAITKLVLLFSLALFSGCQLIMCSTMVNCFDPLGRAPATPDIAYIQVTTPNYMDAHLHVIEQQFTHGRGITYFNKIIQKHIVGNSASGWAPPDPLQTKSVIPRLVVLEVLPNQLKVEWTSLAENKTYRASINLHLGSRRKIRQKVETTCKKFDKPLLARRNLITLQIAPGGRAKAWLSGTCLNAIEIATAKGIAVEKNAYFSNDALNSYDPTPMEKYIQMHGIAFESWQ